MDKRTQFNETLTSFVEFAATLGNEVSIDDVKLYFKDFIEDESQYQFIYDYLTINKINIKEYDAPINEKSDSEPTPSDIQSENTAESEEELSFIKMYMKELETIPPVSDDEKSTLVSKLLSGNLDVINRLVECHLSLVAEIAEAYRNQGVTFGDLIQEGNIGLMLGLSDYDSRCGDFDTFIREKITAALDEIVNSQIHSDRIGQHLADKLNQLDATTKNLSETLGRVPELKELAEAMSISEDEVSLLLKTSLDTLSVNEDTQLTDEDNASENNDSYSTPAKDPLQWRVNKK